MRTWIAILLVFEFAAFAGTAAAKPQNLVSQLSSIEMELAPHRGQTGKKEGMQAVEAAQARLQPLLENEGRRIESSDRAMAEMLRIGALFCEIDPSNHAVEFLLDFRKAKLFEPALSALSRTDRQCIQQAFEALTSGQDN